MVIPSRNDTINAQAIAATDSQRYTKCLGSNELARQAMHAQRKDRRGDLIPLIVAAFVAVVGQTVILFNDFGPGNNSQDSGNARMITAAAVSRAGAIQISPEPRAGRPVSQTRLASGNVA